MYMFCAKCVKESTRDYEVHRFLCWMPVPCRPRGQCHSELGRFTEKLLTGIRTYGAGLWKREGGEKKKSVDALFTFRLNSSHDDGREIDAEKRTVLDLAQNFSMFLGA